MNLHTFDVAILGGGLAGNLLARQLRRSLPDLKIALFERSLQPSYKVGESTVEIASNYLTRKLGLSNYLYRSQLPKNGLRFFFDTPCKSTELWNMSEIGSKHLPYFPSFQLDRAQFEQDLLDFNVADGIHVYRGFQVRDLQLQEHPSLAVNHEFTATGPEKTDPAQRFQSRWVIDATGRASMIARMKQLRIPESAHRISAVWGRFANVVDLDQYGPPSWRARVHHTSRMLSTNHFCYPGYWIWLIPLRNGLTSIGLVCEASIWQEDLRTQEGFLAFLRQHQALVPLLHHAQCIDLAAYRQLAYGTKQFFSPARWGLTGDAGLFVDPFYSPGSDLIAMSNDFLNDLIRRDFAGDADSSWHDQCQLYDAYMQFYASATLLLYRDLYPILGSYELLKLKWEFDIANYYNLWASAYLGDDHLDTRYLRFELQTQPETLQVLANFSSLFQQVNRQLIQRNEYYRANTGQFYQALSSINFLHELGPDRSRERKMQVTKEILNRSYEQAKLLLTGASTSPVHEKKLLPISHFMRKQTWGWD